MNKTLSVIFPERLVHARKNAGYNTQEAFADIYDKKYNSSGEKSVLGSVKKWERGAAIPKADSLLNICELLNCSADYLLGIQNVQYNNNIDAHNRTGFDDVELENIARLKADKEKFNIVSNKCTEYDVLRSLIKTETGIRLLTEIAYRISRISEYPKCEKVLTSNYAGCGNWLIPVDDLRRSDDMQLFYNILNWINNHNTVQVYESDIAEL